MRLIPCNKAVLCNVIGDTFYEHDAIMSGWGRTNLSYKGSGSSELKHSGNLCIDTPQNCQKYLHVMTGLPPEVLRKYRVYQDYFDTMLCTRTKNISRDVLFGEVISTILPILRVRFPTL